MLALLALALAVTPSRAQDYPTRPVELIVPFAAGGGAELLARLLSEGLNKRFGQPFLVINRPGANTNLGTLSVARSAPMRFRRRSPHVTLARVRRRKRTGGASPRSTMLSPSSRLPLS